MNEYSDEANKTYIYIQHVQEIGSYLLDIESTLRINIWQQSWNGCSLRKDVPLNDAFPEGVAIFHKSLTRRDPQMIYPKAWADHLPHKQVWSYQANPSWRFDNE